MKGADRKKITELCDATFHSSVGTGVSQIAKSIIEELNAIAPDQFNKGTKTYDFKVKSILIGLC